MLLSHVCMRPIPIFVHMLFVLLVRCFLISAGILSFVQAIFFSLAVDVLSSQIYFLHLKVNLIAYFYFTGWNLEFLTFFFAAILLPSVLKLELFSFSWALFLWRFLFYYFILFFIATMLPLPYFSGTEFCMSPVGLCFFEGLD